MNYMLTNHYPGLIRSESAWHMHYPISQDTCIYRKLLTVSMITLTM